LSEENVKGLVMGFLRLLESPDDRVRLDAWVYLWDQVNGFTSPGDVKKYLPSYLKLLSSPDEAVRAGAWGNLRGLAKGFISAGDAKPYLPSYFELLSSSDASLRWQAWKYVPMLVDKGFISAGDAKPYLPSFLQVILPPRNFMQRSGAMDSLPDLINSGLFSGEGAGYYLQLLSSLDISLRLRAWKHVPMLVDKGFISPDEIKDYLPFFIKFLCSLDEHERKEAWSILPELVDKGVL